MCSQTLIQRLGLGLVGALVVLLAGCASVRPWQNLPLHPEVQVLADADTPEEVEDRSLAVVISLSGGGARAAAFGYGVLDALRQTRVHWNDRDITLLDELDVISGVSGGSIIAAYYAAFGLETFPAFEQKFLRYNFQDSLISTLLDVGTLYDLSSPWLGRSHVLARRLDELYAGKTFGDLPSQLGQPRLLVSATDLSLGSSFEFTWRQFELICSDLASVPLSFAVASSSAVPMALSPMTLKNHNDTCQRPPLDVNDTARDDYRVRLLRDNQRSYLDAQARPYIRLVDGGLADNLGLRKVVRRELSRAAADGNNTFAPDAQIHVINVNLRDAPELLGRSMLLQIPTAFSIPPADVSSLIEAGRHILHTSPAFKRLLQSLASDSAAKFKPNGSPALIQ